MPPNILSSTAFCAAAINFVLQLANPNNFQWRTTNDIQHRYLESFGKLTPSETDILSAYLKGKATNIDSDLNNWFAENGFPNMKLSYPEHAMGFGAIFDLLVEWKRPGTKSKLTIDNQVFEAIKMKPGAVAAYNLEGYDYPMFVLDTQDKGWKVHLLETEFLLDDVDLLTVATDILVSKKSPFLFREVIFPSVDMEIDVNLEWLIGMGLEKTPFQINEAKKIVRLKLDDKGARVQSAVAIASRSFISQKGEVYRFTKPFFIIFANDNISIPPFVAIVSQDAWNVVLSSSTNNEL